MNCSFLVLLLMKEIFNTIAELKSELNLSYTLGDDQTTINC
ncbi:hypothetical protein SAMN04488029_3802 [Reichenbachiella faecimaris]|uniref:Uncharacterized protein n=1 Tax=Reichenbachiella faecimaris TaxID=692418 RepID=A0A1W2GQC5_REIFA|nr:hypothetical protein SAMN04488029_3802 [Reichenbachiella faecimaris]